MWPVFAIAAGLFLVLGAALAVIAHAARREINGRRRTPTRDRCRLAARAAERK